MIYLKLFFIFAKIGLFSFGGGIAMLPIIYQNAKAFNLMNQSEFENLVAVSQVTPGPISVNAATYVGYNSAGFLGAFVATFGVVLPSFCIVSLVYYFIIKFRNSKIVGFAFEGIKPVTAGLMAAATVFVARGVLITFNPFPIIVIIVTLILMFFKKLGPISIIALSGVFGVGLKILGNFIL